MERCYCKAAWPGDIRDPVGRGTVESAGAGCGEGGGASRADRDEEGIGDEIKSQPEDVKRK